MNTFPDGSSAPSFNYPACFVFSRKYILGAVAEMLTELTPLSVSTGSVESVQVVRLVDCSRLYPVPGQERMYQAPFCRMPSDGT